MSCGHQVVLSCAEQTTKVHLLSEAHLTSHTEIRSLIIMGCPLSLFIRRQCESSTPPETEYYRTPSSLYLTWLPQLPASSSKPTCISYPTVRDIPSWLLLSPVDIPSTVQANECDM